MGKIVRGGVWARRSMPSVQTNLINICADVFKEAYNIEACFVSPYRIRPRFYSSDDYKVENYPKFPLAKTIEYLKLVRKNGFRLWDTEPNIYISKHHISIWLLNRRSEESTNILKIRDTRKMGKKVVDNDGNKYSYYYQYFSLDENYHMVYNDSHDCIRLPRESFKFL